MKTPDSISTDDFLGGAIKLAQPGRGVRAGADSVFLAAAVDGAAGLKVLDVGTGTGIVALCLAKRVKGVSVDGLELQPDLAALARENVTRNGLQDWVRIFDGDLAAAPADIARNSYDVVTSNPPYFGAGAATASPEASRAVARREGALSIHGWVRECLRFLKPRGFFYVVYRADRLDALLAGLQGRAGDIVVFPLWPRGGVPAKTMIVRARKGGKGPLTLSPGLVLHDASGAYTDAAEAVLRQGAALSM